MPLISDILTLSPMATAQTVTPENSKKTVLLHNHVIVCLHYSNCSVSCVCVGFITVIAKVFLYIILVYAHDLGGGGGGGGGVEVFSLSISRFCLLLLHNRLYVT